VAVLIAFTLQGCPIFGYPEFNIQEMFVVTDLKNAHPASYLMGTRGSFPGVKRPACEIDHSLLSSAEVKECAELYLHSSNTPSWCGAQLKNRENFTFTYTIHI
jgi:hypothetical protein